MREKYTEHFTIALPLELKKTLVLAAEKNNISPSAFIRLVLSQSVLHE